MTETTMRADYEQFRTAVEADGWDLDNPAEAVTLAAFVVGPNIKRIASFLGRPRSWCQEAAHLLRENGVWRAGRIAVENPDGEVDGVEIALQAAVASGFLEVSRGPR